MKTDFGGCLAPACIHTRVSNIKDSNAVAHSVDIKRIENDIECVQFACWNVIITISLPKKSWERCLENDQMVINFGFPTVNCRK